MSDKFKVYEADIADFKPDPKNHNKHTAKGHKMVTNSMQQRGYARPAFAANDGTVLGGNLSTMEVAPAVGLGDGKVIVIETNGDIPIIHKRRDVEPGSTEAKRLSYEDNISSAFDFALDSAVVMADIEAGFDFAAIDVTLPDLGLLLEMDVAELLGVEAGKDTEPQISKAEELQEIWKVQPGQMFALGDHRLICGDCTDRTVVERVMRGERAAATITDPPYNVGIDYANDDNDDKSQANYSDFTQKWFVLAREFSIKQIITPDCYNLALWLKSFDAFYVATWIKTNAMTHGFVSRFFCWEPILFFGGEWFKGNEKMWKRKRANDVFNYPVSEQLMPNGDSLTPLHPCPKPTKLIEDFLENYTEKGDIILEPFLGSGTALIACHNLGRSLRGVEISPAYCSVVLQRFLDHTGIQPVLLTT